MSLLYSFIAGLLYVLHTHSEALALPDADLTNSVDEAIARLNYTNFQNVDLRILNSALENVSDDDLYLQIFTERKGVELIFKWMNSFNVKKAHKSPVLKEICRATTRLLLLGTRSSNFSERVIKCRLLELMVQLSFERILFGDKNFTTEYFSLASDVIANLVKFEHLLSDIQLVVQKKLVEKLVVVQNRFLSERNHLVKLKLGGILALQDLTVLSREDLEWNFAQDRATVINIRAETIDGVGNRQKYFDSTFHSQTRSSDIFSYFNNLLLSEANRIFLCHDNHTLGLYHQVTSLLNTETSGFVPDTDLGIAALRGLYMMTQGCLRCKEYLRRRGITHS